MSIESKGHLPSDMEIRTPVKSKRHEMGARLMRETTRGFVDSFLDKRAGWMLEQTQLVPLLEKKVWGDQKDEPKRIEVLCLGAGKGHEMEKIHDALPNSLVHGVDPHDHYAPPVWERVKESAKDMFYLHESVRAEDLQEIDSGSQDAVTLFFVLHHIDQSVHEKVFAEARRVLKQDGMLFVAEDLVSDDLEQIVTKAIDKRMNLDIADGPHNYRDKKDWETFFDAQGFVVEHEKELKPDKVRHGFFALSRKPTGDV